MADAQPFAPPADACIWTPVSSSADLGTDDLLPFPMYTISVDALLQLSSVVSHEKLMYDGQLTEFDESLGRAMFVSHQWLSNEHPDPSSEQFKVLQEALRNLFSGKSRVTLPVGTQIFQGQLATPTAADFRRTPLYVWYDYFCCPQGFTCKQQVDRQRAISSIASYVAKCVYFVILCPALTHSDQKHLLDQDTWATRGWCRLERLASELASRRDGFMLVIESAKSQQLIYNLTHRLHAPGMGEFTRKEDRDTVARVILQMVWRKLLYFLEAGDLHRYRYLLSTQRACCLMNMDATPIEGLVPGFTTRADPFSQMQAFRVERFLHDNKFRKLKDRDAAGWTPLCYAAANGCPLLVSALLAQRADCNDRISRAKKEQGFDKHMNVLSLAVYFRNNAAVQVLLAARADVNKPNALGFVALSAACVANNAEGVRLLCEARGLPHLGFPGLDAFAVACSFGSSSAMQELLKQRPETNLRSRLHLALMTEGGSSDSISTLIRARADVNEQFERPAAFLWRVFLALQSQKHRFSPSALTSMAYHHRGATPLMCSIICGRLGAAQCLLQAGALTDSRNKRNKTAIDLAKEVGFPLNIFQPLSVAATPPNGSDDAVSSDADTFSI